MALFLYEGNELVNLDRGVVTFADLAKRLIGSQEVWSGETLIPLESLHSRSLPT